MLALGVFEAFGPTGPPILGERHFSNSVSLFTITLDYMISIGQNMAYSLQILMINGK